MNINRFPAIKTHKNRRFMQLNQTVINYSGPTHYMQGKPDKNVRFVTWSQSIVGYPHPEMLRNGTYRST